MPEMIFWICFECLVTLSGVGSLEEVRTFSVSLVASPPPPSCGGNVGCGYVISFGAPPAADDVVAWLLVF